MDVHTCMCFCSRAGVLQSLQDPCQSHPCYHSTKTAPVKPDRDQQDPKSNGHLFLLRLSAVSLQETTSSLPVDYFDPQSITAGAPLVAQMVKYLPAMQETRVGSLGRESPL